jgi:hypothetical protein
MPGCATKGKQPWECISCFPGFRFDYILKRCFACPEGTLSIGGTVANCSKQAIDDLTVTTEIVFNDSLTDEELEQFILLIEQQLYLDLIIVKPTGLNNVIQLVFASGLTLNENQINAMQLLTLFSNCGVDVFG